MNTNITDTFPAIITDRYEIIRLLGEGGMSRVYLAQDKQLPRRVAIKCILSELSDKDEVKKRIKREVQTHASIGTHPNIVTLFDKVEESGRIFLIMEHIEGDTLDIWSTQHDCSQLQIVSIITDVLNALKVIHARNVLHRDVKPENIIITKTESEGISAKLMDFGISYDKNLGSTATKLTQIEVGGPGSPAYMSPEQIDSETFGEVGPASDLYAVGIILYELLTKSPPFTGTMTQILTGHLVSVPNVENINFQPPLLKSILSKALSKKQQKRYTTADQFLSDLAAKETGDLRNDKTQLAVKLGTKDSHNKTQLHIPTQTQSSSRYLLLIVILILGIGAAGAAYYFSTVEGDKRVVVKPASEITETNDSKKKTGANTEGITADSGQTDEKVKVETQNTQADELEDSLDSDESAALTKSENISTAPIPIDSSVTDVRPIDPLNYIGHMPEPNDYSTGSKATDAFKALREKKLEQTFSAATQKASTQKKTTKKVTIKSRITNKTATAKKPNTQSKGSSSSGWTVSGSSSKKVN